MPNRKLWAGSDALACSQKKAGKGSLSLCGAHTGCSVMYTSVCQEKNVIHEDWSTTKNSKHRLLTWTMFRSRLPCKMLPASHRSRLRIDLYARNMSTCRWPWPQSQVAPRICISEPTYLHNQPIPSKPTHQRQSKISHPLESILPSALHREVHHPLQPSLL